MPESTEDLPDGSASGRKVLAEGDPYGEGICGLVGEQGRHFCPRPRPDQLQGQGAGVPGHRSARHETHNDGVPG